MTSIFKYVSSESKKLDNNVTETIISLKDDVYPVEAKLHYVTFAKENVIKAWTEIRHMEKKPVTITQYASNMLYFESPVSYTHLDVYKRQTYSYRATRFFQNVLFTFSRY